MPLAEKQLAPSRAEFHGSLSATDVESLVANEKLRGLQTSSPVPPATWDLLNAEFFSRRCDVELRVYGFYSSVCDLSFTTHLPNVRRFAADCLQHAENVDAIASLPNLELLRVGIYDLGSFDFLENVAPDRLVELSLSATKSKKPSLRHLERFPRLRALYLEGQQKEIDTISQLTEIESLTLRSITLKELGFLRGLKRLWSLEIKLGGSNNLSALEGMAGIKYLELWQVRGLKSLDVLSTLGGLQYLFLQSLPHIARLPDLSALTALRKVYLENMAGLRDVDAFLTAPNLEEVVHVCAQGMEPSVYQGLLGRKNLKRLMVGFGSQKKNETLRALAQRAGVDDDVSQPFKFA